MPSESLADVTQNDWIRACRKLGLEVDTRHGKGSHVLVKHPRDGRKYTIQRDLHRVINLKILKKLVEWGFSEKDVFEAIQ